MNKTELIAAVAEKAGMSKKDAEKAVSAFVETVSAEMAAGGKVQLIGFGSFETKNRPARTARNPRDGKAIEVPAATVPVFKAGKALKEQVNA